MSTTPHPTIASAAASQAEDIAARLDNLALTLDGALLRGRMAWTLAPWTGVGRAELDTRLDRSDRDLAAIVADVRDVVRGLRQP